MRMNSGRYELDSVERRDRRTELCQFSCTHVCRLDSDQQKHSSVSYICQAAFHLALPRSPSLSFFFRITLIQSTLMIPLINTQSHISERITFCGTLFQGVTLTSAYLLFYLRSHHVWVSPACLSVSTSGSLRTSTALPSMLRPPPTTRWRCNYKRKHA